MAIIKALHVQCDVCKYRIENADSGRDVRRDAALYYVRKQGWTHGKRTLCPQCQPKRKGKGL